MGKYTAETQPYKVTPAKKTVGSAPTTYKGMTGKAPNPLSYGKSAGTPNLISGVPSVTGAGSEVGQLPDAFTGNFGIGEDKNVSTPVTGL